MNDEIYKAMILLILFLSLLIVSSVLTLIMASNDINELKEDLHNVNEARIRAENKPCCKVIQERYIDKRLDESGIHFIYEEHPQIMECE